MTVTVDDTKLKAIADAIRAKNGTEETYKPSEMAGAIETLGGNIDALIDRSLTEINSNVTVVGNGVFRDCVNMTSVTLPYATAIGETAFYKCENLTNVYLPVATDIGNTSLAYCYALQKLVLPSAARLGSSSLSYCYGLRLVDLPKATSIENFAFRKGYNLRAIILRSTAVCPIGKSTVFEDCYHLLGEVDAEYNPSGAKDGFIYVPSALVNTYKTAENWSNWNLSFRALENYTVDGTITGELDESKI